ncbi:MAG: hypothetical protein JSS36_07105 [Proteobacteria bacterium]|nr:hypothetical protein [Pseudomonadota bacterium]
MSDPLPPIRPDSDPLAERARIIRERNRMLALVLVGFVVLFFAITLVKVKF